MCASQAGGGLSRARRFSPHHGMMHNHMSRKIFDRACAASKDTIDEIVACVTNNKSMLQAVKEGKGTACYKEAFGEDFKPTDLDRHKDLMCNNRDKFEALTTCIYSKAAESMSSKELEQMTEAMVDVGLCIINALGG